MMPSIKIANQATNTDALSALKFRKILRPSLVSLWCSAVTVTDTISFGSQDRDVLQLANPNIESSADVVDTDRDQILFAEPFDPPDELFMPVTATTAVGFLVLIDEL
jgi:hypothetical protein